jgi:hypothetical protein
MERHRFFLSVFSLIFLLWDRGLGHVGGDALGGALKSRVQPLGSSQSLKSSQMWMLQSKVTYQKVMRERASTVIEVMAAKVYPLLP